MERPLRLIASLKKVKKAKKSLGMDPGRTCRHMNFDVTIYHILFQIRKYEYVYYRIQIQNGYFEFAFAFEYLLDLYHGVITIY